MVEADTDDLKIEVEKTEIAPKEAGLIRVSFDTSGKNGYQNQKITLITNAPDFPILTLRLVGIVE